MSVITDAAPPLPDAIPEGLRAAVMHCLAKERDGRFGNVGELAAALAPFGDADASATATRISKIITSTSAHLPAVITSTGAVPATVANDRTALAAGAPVGGVSAPSSTEPHAPGHPVEAATALARPAKADATPQPLRPVSTFSSSAAELEVPPVELPAKSKKPLVIAGAGIFAVGGIALAIGVGGGGKPDPAPVIAAAPVMAPAPPAEPPLELGKRMFQNKGCAACHSINGKTGVAPTFAGAWGSMVPLSNGDRVKFDENYFRESLMLPNAKIRAGFPPTQPSYEGQLTEAEIGGLIAFVQSLANVPVAEAPITCDLPGVLDTSGKQATEYKCTKIDFKTKACQCEIGAYAMRTADNVAVCHTVRPGCTPPVSEPVATKPATRPTVVTAKPTKPVNPKPGEKPPEKPPDELWMQMTHDKDKAKK